MGTSSSRWCRLRTTWAIRDASVKLKPLVKRRASTAGQTTMAIQADMPKVTKFIVTAMNARLTVLCFQMWFNHPWKTGEVTVVPCVGSWVNASADSRTFPDEEDNEVNHVPVVIRQLGIMDQFAGIRSVDATPVQMPKPPESVRPRLLNAKLSHAAAGYAATGTK
ncbi:hypothetical protein SPBR_02058 [Sporothrix brasiliensis 5110]|uniref:Uncharacterized protein n=1 Tax=Sporothrix brasiliensis 5110 TaxID=1398154 RepID=A0A0C2FJX1_9PEZI|nr:uncharacterized protein SPBR_02058 [Sporothrix brasiliensis 5110]KIH91343.1 hypothetical protein SPBR_02058 [Sporothrix brasiliensis 5110]